MCCYRSNPRKEIPAENRLWCCGNGREVTTAVLGNGDKGLIKISVCHRGGRAQNSRCRDGVFLVLVAFCAFSVVTFKLYRSFNVAEPLGKITWTDSSFLGVFITRTRLGSDELIS